MHRSTRLLTALLVSVLATACQTVLSPEQIGLADSHRDLAEVKLSMNEPEVAIKEYQAAIKLNPDDPESHFGLSEA
ncbi:MAG: tetratricopeptide repeat protein, partial [bacterium]